MLDMMIALCRCSPVPVLGNLAMLGATLALFLAPLHITRRRA